MEFDFSKYVSAIISSLFAAIVAGATILHKGVWKAINLNTKDIDDTRDRISRVEGRCEALHNQQYNWTLEERRKKPR